MTIKNGDIFNIGQTVNGVSTFCWLNGKWYYYNNHLVGEEYQYDQNDLTKLITENEFDQIKHIKNIYTFNK